MKFRVTYQFAVSSHSVRSSPLIAVCHYSRSMNYQDGRALELPLRKGPVWLSSVDCADQDFALDSCLHSEWGMNGADCPSEMAAGVVCFDRTGNIFFFNSAHYCFVTNCALLLMIVSIKMQIMKHAY